MIARASGRRILPVTFGGREIITLRFHWLLRLLRSAFLAQALAVWPQYATAADSRPLIWFAPLDAVYRPWLGYSGAADYIDLFAPDAPWSNAASHVNVFKIYGTLLTSYSEQDLTRMFAELKRRNIALALEFGPLTLPRGGRCPQIEGFERDGVAKDYARRIKQAGGELQYLAMDEPFYFAAMHAEPAACRWSTREVAENAVANLNVFKKEFPNLMVGDIEPVPAVDGQEWLDRYREWIEAYRAASGSNLAFFHADVRWTAAAWKESATALRDMLNKQKVPFGMIYNASADGPNEWLSHAQEHFVAYEAYALQPPEHVIFQSWHPDPRRVLPETDGRAFTSLINRYVNRASVAGPAAKRPSQPEPGGARSRSVPAPATIPPLATIKGTVPLSATMAVAAIRINAECACRGSSDLTVTNLRYRDGAERGQETTLDFTNANWWLRGDATLRLEMANGDESLRILASPLQSEIINSPPFKVTPGASFVFEAFGQMPPESKGSGYFAVIFRSGSTEVSRMQFPL